MTVKIRRTYVVVLELSQQFVSAVFGLVCGVCVHAASAYTLPALSTALNGPHSHTHFLPFLPLFQSEGAKPNGMGKRRRRGCQISRLYPFPPGI